MLFRKRLNKHLKNIVYKYSLTNKFIKNSYYMLYSYTPTPIKHNNSFKPITTPKTIIFSIKQLTIKRD